MDTPGDPDEEEGDGRDKANVLLDLMAKERKLSEELGQVSMFSPIYQGMYRKAAGKTRRRPKE